MTSSKTDNSHDQGSVVVALALISSVMVLVSFAALGARLAVDHRIAQSAADLAALAGAQDLVGRPDAVCDQASDVALANRTRVTHCRVQGDSVWVTVVRDSVRRVHLSATARAGYGESVDQGVQQQ